MSIDPSFLLTVYLWGYATSFVLACIIGALINGTDLDPEDVVAGSLSSALACIAWPAIVVGGAVYVSVCGIVWLFDSISEWLHPH